MRPASAGQPWEVHVSGVVAKALRALQVQASQEGRGEAVLAAFRRVIEELRRDPTVFGEPLYRLPALRMQVRSASVRPLVVHFAVSEDRSLVFMNGVQLLSG